MATLGKNQVFEIKNGDGTSFHNLVLRKSAVEIIVMSLGDKISGDVYYKDNSLSVTMHEYITYNGVNYMLVNPPTIVREGIVSDNSELKGMTKYSFVFYHPMYQLANFPFSDVAVTSDETSYLSEGKTFSWIGKPADFVAKLNKNLTGTEWIVEISSRFPQDKLDELSGVIPFDNATIADACKTFYDVWGVPYVVDKVASTEASYVAGKRFKLVMGLPSNEIYENAAAEQQNTPFVFQMGHGVGLKNNSRTPRNNKIITRISGYGSENNIPYGYPQVRWYGAAGQAFTYGDHAGIYTDVTIAGVHLDKVISYPIYKGILDGEYVELIKHPFTRAHLMPSVYRTCLFNKISFLDDNGEFNTDYDPDISLIDYYDAVYSSQYPYPNTINLQAPSYESHEFEDEKPELGEAHIISATPLNNDLTPASSWDDSLDDDGNYKQSYFKMVLPQLSFDLYACASITEEMQINMRSGACIGCTFTVQVDWDDYKRNFYDKDGNFAPNGSQRDLTKYPKSNRGSISLILQKDNSTFGTLMPNMYQYPNGETSTDAGDGDSFVILGISLPESYIFSAEWRLDEDMKSYMLENNVHYYDYPLKFDENFLFHNENILSQIHPNTIVRFNYAGQTLSLFVKQLTIKYGDQPLPQYDITLTDNIEVTLNQIGQVAEDVESLSSLISIIRQSYGKNVWSELSKKLSKVDNDIAYGDLDFRGHVAVGKDLDIKGAGSVEKDFRIGGRETVNEIQSTEYTGDGLLDTGYRLWYQEGRAKLVIDDLVARGKFTVNELETRIWTYAGGNMVFSGAGSTLFFVEYLDASDNPLGYTYINQPWLLRGRALLAGGLAWSKRKAIQRELTEAEKSQVVKFRCYEFSDDGTMQTRNWWKPNDIAMCETLNKVRSKANSDGSYSGSASNAVYKRRVAGIGSKQIPMLNDGRVYDYVDLWNIYDLAGGSCKYKGTDGQEHLITDSVKGYDSSYHDWPAAGDVIVQMGNPLDTDRQSAVTIEVQGDVHGFKVYDTISDYSMANKLWVEIGYDQTTGKAKANVYGDFRFGCRESEEVNGGSYVKYNRTDKVLDIKAKINAQSTMPYNGSDTTLANIFSGLNQQIDGKIETWQQDSDPASDWTTDDLKAKHVGDLWMDTSSNGGKKTYIYKDKGDGANPRYDWVQQDVPQAVFDGIDGKASVYSSWDAWGDKLHLRDLLIPSSDIDRGSGVVYKASKVYRCTQVNPPVFEEVSYTDDTAFNGYINALLNGTTISGDADTAAKAQHVVIGALKGDTVTDGGLLLTSLIAMRKLRSDSLDPTVPSNYDTWGGISGMYDARSEEQGGAKGHGIAAWYGGAMVDMEDVQTLPSSYAKSLFRMDGTGYLANGNIKWDANGDGSVAGGKLSWSTDNQGKTTITLNGDIVKAANYYLNGNDITQQLQNLFDMFEKVNVADQGETPYYMIHAKYGIYADGDLQALGYSPSQGGGGGASVLYELNDVSPNAAHNAVLGIIIDDQNPQGDGYVLTYDYNSKHWIAAPAAETYHLPQATSQALGGIKIGYTPGAGETRNYAVVLDNDGKAYVNVPWSGGTQSDWNESDSSSLAYIKNKPSLATVATSGSYNDLSNKPTIPSVSASVNGSTLTVTINGTDYSLTDTNTWRPLGTGATDAAAGNHTHSYLPLSGGTLSGAITFSQNSTTINFTGGEYLDQYGNFWFAANSGEWSVLSQGSVHRLTVKNSTGNVGIGDANPAYKLEVGGDCRIATKLMVATTSTSYELNVGGNIGCSYLYASSDVQVTSDERRKDVIGDVQLSVEQIAQMPSVLFRWKKGFGDDLIHVGTIAQSWEKVLPAAVGIGTDDDRTRSFSYSAAAYAMAHADACEIVALKKRVSELEAELKRYKSA